MEGLRAVIRNGIFAEVFSNNLNIKTDKFVEANDWKCTIHNNGAIECIAAYYYYDGRHSIRYYINRNGCATLTLYTPNEKKTIKTGSVVPKGIGVENGVLTLTSGNIDKRHASFMLIEQQEFLDRHNITYVKYCNPNRDYKLHCYINEKEEVYTQIYSDGSLYSDGISRMEEDKDGEEFTTTIVQNATWVILDRVRDKKDFKQRISVLYTLERCINALNIPY